MSRTDSIEDLADDVGKIEQHLRGLVYDPLGSEPLGLEALTVEGRRIASALERIADYIESLPS